MGYMDKRPSRMQGEFYFLKSGGAGNNFQNFRFVLWQLPESARSFAPNPIHLPLKVHRGKFSVHNVQVLIDYLIN
jgi:hypothetical protein